MTVSQAIGELMSMGQFIDASLFFKEGLEVLERMPDTPGRKILEIGGTFATSSRNISSKNSRCTVEYWAKYVP